MKRRVTTQLVILVVLAAVLLALTDTWARQNSAFDQLDLLVDVRHELISNYVEKPDQQKMVEAAVQGMIESLEDPYTSYLTAEDVEMFDHYVRGSFSGIGAEVDIYEDRLRIVTPLEDSPAWEAGVMAGDIVLEIDGESTAGMEVTDAVKKLTGEAGTTVEILVRHESGEEELIEITRDVINVQTVRGFQRQQDQHYDFMLDDQRGIGYVRMTQFTERTADELRAALEQLKAQGAQALVLDVRFNPGGLLESAVEVADMFLGEGKTIVSVEGRVVNREEFQSTSGAVLPDIPVVVLANEASASAAEIVTGALKDNDRALFVGTRTFGKGSVQQVKMLDGGHGALKMTNAYYYIPSGRLIHRRPDSEEWGVDPSEGSYVPMSPEQVREMVDLRREGDELRKDNGDNGAAEVTPQWIREKLADDQLAAAVEAVRGRLETGEWPQVGESGTEALVAANKRANLVLRRSMLQERLEEIEAELEAVDAGESGAAAAVDGEVPAKDELLEEDELSPTDPKAVQQEIQQQQEGVLQSDELTEPAEAGDEDAAGDTEAEPELLPQGQ